MKNILVTICSVLLLLSVTICSGTMLNLNSAHADYAGEINAKSAILVDFDSFQVVYEKDASQKLPIASMVKLMTIYLTFKNLEDGNLSYDQKITTSEKASGMGGSQVFIDPYVTYTVNDLLKSVIVSSANDASVALAESISGSEEQFVYLMNQTAKELGMLNTLYCNCTGLPAPNQYSTALDCAIILKNLLSFEDYHKYSSIWMDTLIHPSGRKTELVNTNKLIKYFDGCDGGKTGSTSEAGYCLTASAKRDNTRLISVVIGAKSGSDRFKESINLLNYGFANYQNKELINKDNIIAELKTKRCKQEFAQVVAIESFYAFDKKGAKSAYDINYELPGEISATSVGEIIGNAIVSKEGNVIKVIPLTVKSDIHAMSYKDNLDLILGNW